MTEDDVVRTIRTYIDTKFPMDCPKCGLRYGSLAEYLRRTTHTGDPISYDADDEDWQPLKPLGTISLANCPCGTTLSIGSRGIGVVTMWRLLRWAREEKRRRGIGMGELLTHLRQRIDEEALREGEADAPPDDPVADG